MSPQLLLKLIAIIIIMTWIRYKKFAGDKNGGEYKRCAEHKKFTGRKKYAEHKKFTGHKNGDGATNYGTALDNGSVRTLVKTLSN
jgi:hypothetical protein